MYDICPPPTSTPEWPRTPDPSPTRNTIIDICPRITLTVTIFLNHRTVTLTGPRCSRPSWIAKSSTSFGWGKYGNATSVGWQVTPCDSTWHMSSRCGESGLHYPCEPLYRVYYFYYWFLGEGVQVPGGNVLGANVR